MTQPASADVYIAAAAAPIGSFQGQLADCPRPSWALMRSSGSPTAVTTVAMWMRSSLAT